MHSGFVGARRGVFFLHPSDFLGLPSSSPQGAIPSDPPRTWFFPGQTHQTLLWDHLITTTPPPPSSFRMACLLIIIVFLPSSTGLASWVDFLWSGGLAGEMPHRLPRKASLVPGGRRPRSVEKLSRRRKNSEITVNGPLTQARPESI